MAVLKVEKGCWKKALLRFSSGLSLHLDPCRLFSPPYERLEVFSAEAARQPRSKPSAGPPRKQRTSPRPPVAHGPRRRLRRRAA